MALTNIQRDVCRVLAKQRIASGESYVAGGVALNALLGAPRISQDLDLFHDTTAAFAATWSDDRAALLRAGYEIEVVRERPAFVEAMVRRGTEAVILQWTHGTVPLFAKCSHAGRSTFTPDRSAVRFRKSSSASATI